jgi:hypothetical protein
MKKIILFSIGLISLISIFNVIFPSSAFAATYTNISGNACVYKGGDDIHKDSISEATGQVLTLECLPIMFFNLVYWLLIFAGVAALFMVIFGGFRFMTSGGDPKAVEGARKTITWAIIGLIVVLLSFAIVSFIAQVTGVRCITKFGLLGTC